MLHLMANLSITPLNLRGSHESAVPMAWRGPVVAVHARIQRRVSLPLSSLWFTATLVSLVRTASLLVELLESHQTAYVLELDVSLLKFS